MTLHPAKPNRVRHICCVVCLFMAVGLAESGGQELLPDLERRLGQLSPTDLTDYRNLAEELSLISTRPAQNLTVRLYLLTAANAESGPLQRSALKGLLAFARDPEELKRFQALAFLTDPEFADLVLDPVDQQDEMQNDGTPPAKSETSPRTRLLDALISVRQGKPLRAKKIMEDSEVQKLFSSIQSEMSVSGFNQVCLKPELPAATLAFLLRTDMKLRYGKGLDLQVQDRSEWRRSFQQNLPPRVPKIDFTSVTEFDPTQVIYRSGVWQRPPR